MFRRLWPAIAGLALIPAFTMDPARSHATLESGQAAVKSVYKATIRIAHGCDGSATERVRIRIPDGYIAVKPMPKAGWTLDTVRAPYQQTVKLQDETLTAGVREVIWTGRLPDGQYEEFVMSGFLAGSLEPGSRLYFPVVQECEIGTLRWIEVPSPSQPAADLKQPAPGLKLLPASP